MAADGEGESGLPAAAATAAPSPRSPPKYPDFCGRRRLQLEVQILNREVGFLEEELQSLEGLQPVSRCCKEVNEFVSTNPDPLIPLNKKRRRSCRIWRWLGSKLCFTFSWICCCTGCSNQLKRLSCTCCPHPKNLCCCHCCRCCHCCFDVSCSRPSWCCFCPKPSCCGLSPCCCFWDLSCCRLPRCCCSSDLSCCRPPQCCCREVPCCRPSQCCCRPSQCCSREVSCCRPLQCCCREGSCCKLPQCCFLPTFACPEYSCGCIWDCPKCTGVQLCPKCSKPCCITGCLC